MKIITVAILYLFSPTFQPLSARSSNLDLKYDTLVTEIKQQASPNDNALVKQIETAIEQTNKALTDLASLHEEQPNCECDMLTVLKTLLDIPLSKVEMPEHEEKLHTHVKEIDQTISLILKAFTKLIEPVIEEDVHLFRLLGVLWEKEPNTKEALLEEEAMIVEVSKAEAAMEQGLVKSEADAEIGENEARCGDAEEVQVNGAGL